MTHFSTPSSTENQLYHLKKNVRNLVNECHLLLEVFNGSSEWIGVINCHVASFAAEVPPPSFPALSPASQHLATYFSKAQFPWHLLSTEFCSLISHNPPRPRMSIVVYRFCPECNDSRRNQTNNISYDGFDWNYANEARFRPGLPIQNNSNNSRNSNDQSTASNIHHSSKRVKINHY